MNSIVEVTAKVEELEKRMTVLEVVVCFSHHFIGNGESTINR